MIAATAEKVRREYGTEFADAARRKQSETVHRQLEREVSAAKRPYKEAP